VNFYRSLAVAAGVTGTVLGLVLLTGLMTDNQMEIDGFGSDLPETIRIQAVPIRLGGYGLQHKRGEGDVVMLSISVRVANEMERGLVCRLAPRLIAAVTQDIGQQYSDPETLSADITTTLPGKLQRRFNRALKADLIDSVTIEKITAGSFVPPATCAPPS
jgi:hypothetical protein